MKTHESANCVNKGKIQATSTFICIIVVISFFIKENPFDIYKDQPSPPLL